MKRYEYRVYSKSFGFGDLETGVKHAMEELLPTERIVTITPYGPRAAPVISVERVINVPSKFRNRNKRMG